MLETLLRPLRSVVRAAEHEALSRTPLEQTESDILDAVKAVHQATTSIEHHVEVIEGLATSVGPLTESVNQLTATMTGLVALLGPLAAAEHGVQDIERDVKEMGHLFGHHRHAGRPDPERP